MKSSEIFLITTIVGSIGRAALHITSNSVQNIQVSEIEIS